MAIFYKGGGNNVAMENLGQILLGIPKFLVNQQFGVTSTEVGKNRWLFIDIA